ncbi:right-handed parallel beta-helix repeat-containing protein [Leifsonia xyli]|uniref:right-handed parallel beta-helix repeat-containing protein n=1 Tax=Leifsonia xyli TaxID=1575 RepID=UPI000AA24420
MGIAAVAATAAVTVPLGATAATSYELGKTIVSDDFNRSIATGWGDAPVGGAYTVSKSAGQSVSPSGGGTLTAPSPGHSTEAVLGSVSERDIHASDELTVPALPLSGNGVYTGLRLRIAGGHAYVAQLRVTPRGTANLSFLRVGDAGGAQATLAAERVVVPSVRAGQRITIEAQTTGAAPVDFSARAYTTGATVPAWQVTGADASQQRLSGAGAFGIWTYASSASSPVALRHSGIRAQKLVPATTGGSTPAPTTTPKPTGTPTPTPPATTPTPTPTPSQPAPPVTPPAPEQPNPGTPVTTGIDLTGVRSTTGSAEPGQTSYPVPAGALFVSPQGSDSATGSQGSPFRTVAAAVAKATSGQTIVLRAGTYNESVTLPPGKQLTLQSYPKEAVWFDGSVPVTNWTKSGSVWVATGWNHVFDHSPTYSRGAADGTASGWQWINPSFPMAAHPDQLFVKGTSQRQVTDASKVVAGTFAYNEAAKTLITGTDPTGGDTRASTLQKAFTIANSGDVLRGFGIRRYADSVPDMGVLTATKGGTTLENIAVTDSATQGISLGGANNVLRNVTVARNGLTGVHADYADNLTVQNLLAAGNTAERFNTSPVSGGMKITRSRGVTVTGSAFVGNYGQGFWTDMAVYDMTFANNDYLRNLANGLDIEISQKALVSNIKAIDNSQAGVKVDSSADVQIWNSTLADNKRNVDITQSTRRGTNAADYGHDPRRPFPDPEMTWISSNVQVRNSVLSGSTGNCLLCMEDYSHQFSAAALKTVVSNTLFQRPSTSQPGWVVIWSRGAGDPAIYSTLPSFQAATGQGGASTELIGPSLVTAAGSLTSAALGQTGALATAPPAVVTSLAGKPAGVPHLGAW